MNTNKQIIKATYLASKQEIKDLIASDDLLKFINDTSDSNKLTNEQKNSLGDEIVQRLISITNKETFPVKISNRLSIETNVASVISEKVEGYLVSKLSSNLFSEQQKIAEAIMSGQGATLQSIPEIRTEETSLVPTVVVEKQGDLPMVVKGERPFDSAQGKPFDSAQGKPKTALTFEERKKLVPNIPDNKVHYEGGVDPYREQF